MTNSQSQWALRMLAMGLSRSEILASLNADLAPGERPVRKRQLDHFLRVHGPGAGWAEMLAHKPKHTSAETLWECIRPACQAVPSALVIS